MKHQNDTNRRPLSIRNFRITKRIAKWLSKKNISPNQISLMSIVFAALGYLVAVIYHFYPSPFWLLFLLIAIQMRLICNLFDGMVAIEGGKLTPVGELFNDVPDRIADPIFILAAGLIAVCPFAMTLAWVAALLSILTAYVRVLGVSMGCPANFEGPMAKQHRMALLTITSLILLVSQSFSLWTEYFIYTMDVALATIIAGTLLTNWRRLKTIYRVKSQQSDSLTEGYHG
ncbi:CDP-alcohol phosphatidyltransferase family protein [Vibrio zhanjiangensis]|nr:CDP-alcohol phosphatidyltransferase family protein [Vibrio zhanjiangensis]